jgi:hypothetical protein
LTSDAIRAIQRESLSSPFDGNRKLVESSLGGLKVDAGVCNGDAMLEACFSFWGNFLIT